MSIPSHLIEAYLKDPELKAKLIANPAGFLADRGIRVPAGVTLKVVENTPTLFHIVLPSTSAAAGELADEELASAAGGGEVWTQTNGITGSTNCIK